MSQGTSCAGITGWCPDFISATSLKWCIDGLAPILTQSPFSAKGPSLFQVCFKFVAIVICNHLISSYIGQIDLWMIKCHYVCTKFLNTLRHQQGFCLLIIAQRLVRFYHPGCNDKLLKLLLVMGPWTSFRGGGR